MLRSTHVNMTLTVWLSTMIMSSSFSLHLFFVWIYAILQDSDHHAWFFKNTFWFSLPFKHRWFTHTLLFILLVMLLINISIFSHKMWYDVTQILSMDNIRNYIEGAKIDNMFLLLLLHWHLLWDFLTQRWIPYLWPFFKWNIWLGIFTTGEKTGWDLTGEMVLNFLFSIINIGLLTHIGINYDKYLNLIEPEIKQLQNWWDLNTILTFAVLQLIFVIFLFWNDIKNYIKNFHDFITRILKVLTFSAIWFWISFAIIFLLWLFTINLTDVLANITDWQLVIEWLNAYFSTFLTFSAIWYALYLTKKYIVSISSTISYMINVTYILFSLWLLYFLL